MPFTRRQYLGRVGFMGSVGAAVILSHYASNQPPGSKSAIVRIYSMTVTKLKILGYLSCQRLRTIDCVQGINEFGSKNSLSDWEIIISGRKHPYWENTRTALLRLPTRHETQLTDPNSLFGRVQSDAQQLLMIEPFPFLNRYVIVTDEMCLEQTEVSIIYELASHLPSVERISEIAVNEGDLYYQYWWRGLASYSSGSTNNRRTLVSRVSIDTPIEQTHAVCNQEQVRTAGEFATYPQINRSTITMFEDERNYSHPYQPGTTAYAPLIGDQPEVFGGLSPVRIAINRATMGHFNKRVPIERDYPFAVATQFLDEEVAVDA